MIARAGHPAWERVGGPLHLRKLGGLPRVLVPFVPLVALGLIGGRFGADTLPGAALINIGYMLAVAVAWLMLQRQGVGWREIGLARPSSLVRTVLIGVGVLFAAFVAINLVQIVAVSLPGDILPPDESRFNILEGNLPLLMVLIVAAWTTFAFGEEMMFRAFLITRLAEIFQNTKAPLVFAAVGSSVAFGLAHYGEGPLGLATNGAFGLVLASAFLLTRRNLWVTIITHGLANTLRFVVVFLGVLS